MATQTGLTEMDTLGVKIEQNSFSYSEKGSFINVGR